MQELVSKLKTGEIVVKRSEESNGLIGTNGIVTADSIESNFAQTKKDIGAAAQASVDYTNQRAEELKGYTDSKISSILEVNNDGTINTIQEIIAVIGNDKEGTESIFKQLSTKASVEEVVNVTSNLEKSLDMKTAANSQAISEVQSFTNATFNQIASGIDSAVSIIDGINF
jgi:hypothetical protein